MEPSSANAAHHYSQVLVEKIQSIIDKDPKVVGPITKWGLVLDILKVHKIAYVVEDIDPDMMLVHPDNRSKLGVNPFNAHRVGAYIHRVGADMELLTKATCSELSPIEATRKRQIDFNHQLVSSSAGMLAPCEHTCCSHQSAGLRGMCPWGAGTPPNSSKPSGLTAQLLSHRSQMTPDGSTSSASPRTTRISSA